MYKIILLSLLLDTQQATSSVQQLLTHTSGIPHNEGIADYRATALLLRYPKSNREFYGKKVNVQLIFKEGGLETEARWQTLRLNKQ